MMLLKTGRGYTLPHEKLMEKKMHIVISFPFYISTKYFMFAFLYVFCLEKHTVKEKKKKIQFTRRTYVHGAFKGRLDKQITALKHIKKTIFLEFFSTYKIFHSFSVCRKKYT